MKFYLKVFIYSMIIFSLIFGGIFYIFMKNVEKKNSQIVSHRTAPIVIGDEDELVEDNRTELERLVDASDRVNVLAFGIDGGRADTIMFVSYSPSDQLVDIVSIPRDTYNPVVGHDLLGQKKINAVYGFANGGGSQALADEVSKLLNVPIDYYVKLNYTGVANIVNTLGGVTVNVHKHLKYDDEYCKPPLHIDIPAGNQLLDGANAVKYLRWRKNNGEEGTGDIGRIQRQQDFVLRAARKAISFKLPVVIKTAFNYIRTDMDLDTMLYYATTASDFNFDNIKVHRLPGEVKTMSHLSYFLHDPAKTEDLMKSLYNRIPE